MFNRKYIFYVFVVVIVSSTLIGYSYYDIFAETNMEYLLSPGIRSFSSRHNTSDTNFENPLDSLDFSKTSRENLWMIPKHTNTSMDTKDEADLFRNHFVSCPGPIGRLGNQMFQLAAVIGLAHSLNFVPVINVSHPLVKLFELGNIKHDSDVRLINVKKVNQNWIHESKENNRQHNLTIAGYFQSWKYFQNASGAVRKALTVKPKYLEAAKLFLSRYITGSKTIIGIHIRRGDFLTPAKQAVGRVVADRNYTSKAMDFYRQRYKDARFVVCSNDIKWCKKNINGSDVIFSDFKEPVIDMAIMSLCHHMIISSGSYSWWGGWLSGGTVVYLSDFPRRGSKLDSSLKESYNPPHWIGMSNGLRSDTHSFHHVNKSVKRIPL